jgi:molybdopterin-guanine dinucleotide biosynthesis protein A
MGKDKMTLEYRGKTFPQAALERFAAYFDTVWLSLADPEKYPGLAARRLPDRIPGCGPMSGLHAALCETRDGGVFLVAGDMPFSDPRAALKIIDLAAGYDIAAAAGESGRPEPLFAYYRKTVLQYVEEALKGGDYKLASLFPKAKTLTVTPEMLGEYWNERILLNVNTPEDFSRLSGLLSPESD